MEHFHDILVVDLLGTLAQLVLLLPLLHGLTRRYPGASVRVITRSPAALLLRGDPAVTEVLTPGGAEPARAVAAAIARRRPDLALATTPDKGIADLLAAAGVPRVVHLPSIDDGADRPVRVLCEENLLDRADDRPPRLHLSAADRVGGRRALADALLPLPARAPVVAVLDTGMPVRSWPERHWNRFAQLIGRAGHPLLTVGAAGSAPRLPHDNLRRLAACFAAVPARGGVVVGGDTGLLHVAAAAGARTVALFGPTDATRYGPARRGGAHVQGLPDCPHRRSAATDQVCWPAGDCPLSATDAACLRDIAPEQVARLALGMLRRRPPRARRTT